jgi:hypothetical protein
MTKQILTTFIITISGIAKIYAINVNTQTCDIQSCRSAVVVLQNRINNLEKASTPTFLSPVTLENIAQELKDTFCKNPKNFNPNGNLCLMTKKEALNYCAKIGATLPSALDVAKLHHSMGAKGFINTDAEYRIEKLGPNSALVDSYKFVNTIDYSLVEFIFSYAGFPVNKGDGSPIYFWSSSTDERNYNVFYESQRGQLAADSYGPNSPNYSVEAFVQCVLLQKL